MTCKKVATALVVLAALAASAGASAGPDETARRNDTAHTELKSSVPGRDTVLRSPLDRVQLVFSGPVEAKLSRVAWVSPGGDTVSLAVSAVPDQPHVLVTPAPPSVNGAQRLLWRTVSADGHQVNGEIPFVSDVPGLAAADTSPPLPVDAVDSTGASEPTRDTPAVAATGPSLARYGVRWLGMFCLLGFAGLLWFGLGTTILDEPRSHRLASALGLGAAVLLSLDLMLWLSDLRLPDMTLAATLAATLDTRSGMVEAARAGLALLAFLLFTGARGLSLGAVAGMLAVVVGALGGHQATISPAVSLPANGLHLGAAAVWTGGILLLSAWPSRIDADNDVGWTFGRIALRVSTAALWASGAILVTGIIQDVLYLPSIEALFTSDYGRLLLGKTAGFVALAAFGAYNRFRLIPALATAEAAGAGDGASGLRLSVRFELLVMIVVVLVAVALAQVSPPGA